MRDKPITQPKFEIEDKIKASLAIAMYYHDKTMDTRFSFQLAATR